MKSKTLQVYYFRF